MNTISATVDSIFRDLIESVIAEASVRGHISPPIKARSDARALLKAARDELDAIVGEGLAPDAADRLDGAAALVEEAMGKLEAQP